MTGDLRSLLKRERWLQQKVSIVEKFVQEFNKERDECQIDVRLQALEEAYMEFFELREKIDVLMEDGEEDDNEDDASETSKKGTKTKADAHTREQESFRVSEAFENRYCKLKGALMKLRPVQEPVPRTGENQVNQSSAAHSKVKLPEISLPTFTGKLGEWVMFRDTFRSLIHQNAQLNQMDKFTYLRTSLSGDALKEINTIELSAANYQVAWKVLQERYENKKLIVKAFLDAFFRWNR